MNSFVLATRLELMKFYSARLWWIVAAVAVVAVGGISLMVASSVTPVDGAPVSVTGYAYSVAGRVGFIFPLLVGTLLVTNEYRHGTMTQAILTGLPREAVLAGKLWCALSYALCLGILASALSGLSVVFQFAQAGRDAMLTHPEHYLILVRTPMAYAIWGLIGVGFGFLLRSQIAAVLTVLGFTLIVEPILTSTAGETAWFAGVGKFLPGAASLSLVWPPDTDLQGVLVSLGSLEGGVVLFAYAAVVVLLAYLTFRRQEIPE